MPVSLCIRPNSEYSKFLCLLYRFIIHTHIWLVSTRKKSEPIYYRVQRTWLNFIFKYLGHTFFSLLKSLVKPVVKLRKIHDSVLLNFKSAQNFFSSSIFPNSKDTRVGHKWWIRSDQTWKYASIAKTILQLCTMKLILININILPESGNGYPRLEVPSFSPFFVICYDIFFLK